MQRLLDGLIFVEKALGVHVQRKLKMSRVKPLAEILSKIFVKNEGKMGTLYRGGGQGGGGTGMEGAESGVEGAESGVEGAGSGSRGGGKRSYCGRGSGKIGGRNCFFY